MSLLSRLFRRSSRKPAPSDARVTLQATPPLEPALAAATEPDPLVAQPTPATAPEAPAPPDAGPAADPGLEEADKADEADEAEEVEGRDAGEEIGPDPFVGSGEPLQISLPTSDGVAADRREAEQLALSGPQRVTLTDPAGPGSLAETLARLEAEGRVVGEVIDDPQEGPFILYRPVVAGPA